MSSSARRRFRLRDLGFLRGDGRRGRSSLLGVRPFVVRGFGFANQLVRFLRRHLTALDHVLHEIARALDRESGDARGGTDDIFIAAATLLPASWLISCARSAISATVSRMSAPRWPGRRGPAGTPPSAGGLLAADGSGTGLSGAEAEMLSTIMK